MAVFPESMTKLDPNDTAGSLMKIENYIRYMTERMEFANSNTFRTVSEAGVSNVEIYKMILGLGDTVALVNANITNLYNRLNALQGDVSAQAETISGINTALADLTERVAALEAGAEG